MMDETWKRQHLNYYRRNESRKGDVSALEKKVSDVYQFLLTHLMSGNTPILETEYGKVTLSIGRGAVVRVYPRTHSSIPLSYALPYPAFTASKRYNMNDVKLTTELITCWIRRHLREFERERRQMEWLGFGCAGYGHYRSDSISVLKTVSERYSPQNFMRFVASGNQLKSLKDVLQTKYCPLIVILNGNDKVFSIEGNYPTGVRVSLVTALAAYSRGSIDNYMSLPSQTRDRIVKVKESRCREVIYE